MRRVAVVAVVLASAALAHGEGPDKGVRDQTEVDWAEGVVADFLKALKRNDDRQARQLLTAELRDWYDKGKIRLPEEKLDRSRPDWTWQFGKAQVAPDRGEVVLEGRLSGAFGDRVEVTFTARVVKVKEARSRIDYFLFGELRDRPGKN